MKALLRIQAIIIKELVQLKRDRMTFAMVIMIPLVQLLLFAFAINTNVRHIPVGVLDQSQTGLSRVLQQTVAATNIVSFTRHYVSLPNAQAAIDRGEVRAVLIIPQDASQRLVRHASVGFGSPPASDQETSRPIAQWLVDGTDTAIASSIKSLRNMPLAALLDKPVNRQVPTFEITLLYNPEQRSVVNIVPGLVGIILTMTMIMFTSAAIVRERERGNMELLITTPIASLELMIGKIFPYIFIGAIQVMIILGLGYYFLRHIERNAALLFLVPADAEDYAKEYEILLNELKVYNPELMDKDRLLAISKSDMLDDELKAEIAKTLPTNVPHMFISSVAQQGLDELKDRLWKMLN